MFQGKEFQGRELTGISRVRVKNAHELVVAAPSKDVTEVATLVASAARMTASYVANVLNPRSAQDLQFPGLTLDDLNLSV